MKRKEIVLFMTVGTGINADIKMKALNYLHRNYIPQ